MVKSPPNNNSPDTILDLLTAANKCLAIAHRNKKSLTGVNPYARKFAELHAQGVVLLRELRNRLETSDAAILTALEEVDVCVATYFNTATKKPERQVLDKRVRFLFATIINPALAGKPQHVPEGQLFPLEIIPTSRSYLIRIAEQANGCFEQGWYDASAVMVRRLLETLIIECFERYKIEARIKDKQGNFPFLRDLIQHFMAETAWNVSRNLRSGLPKYKEIGDLSAHNRRFIAKQRDLAENKMELRQVIQELVVLADYNSGVP